MLGKEGSRFGGSAKLNCKQYVNSINGLQGMGVEWISQKCNGSGEDWSMMVEEDDCDSCFFYDHTSIIMRPSQGPNLEQYSINL